MKIDWDAYIIKANNSESAHQIALMAWANDPETRKEYLELEWLFHIPNGGSRHKAEAGKLKAMGVKPGVPDLFLPVSRHIYHGLFIELKNETGKLSKLQSEWSFNLRNLGYLVEFCFGWKMARDCIIEYLNKENRNDIY